MKKLSFSEFTINIIFILTIITVCFTIRYYSLMDQGITWDEPPTVSVGYCYIYNIAHMNFHTNAWMSMYEHPPLGKFIYGIVAKVFIGQTFSINYDTFYYTKLSSTIMGTLTCLIVYFIGKEFYTKRIAVLAALILAMIPPFIAHNQIAALDTPVTLFFTLTLYLFMLCVKYRERKYFLLSAISLGLLISTKFNGLLAIPIMLIYYLLSQYKQNKENNIEPGQKEHILISIYRMINRILPIGLSILFILIALLAFYLLWPWLWTKPDNILLSLQHWQGSPTEYFLGNLAPATILYFPVYFLATTPELLLLLVFVGGFYLATSRDPVKYLPLIWLIIPFAYGLSNFIQDNIRYILMIYPAAAIVAAFGVVAISDFIARARSLKRVNTLVFPVIAFVVLAYLLIMLASACPYYLDYYNSIFGSTAEISENHIFEIGWWGEGISDCVRYVESHAMYNSTIVVAANPDNICFLNVTYEYQSIPNTNLINNTITQNATYLITNTFSEWYGNVTVDTSEYQLVYVSTVRNASLAKVYERIPTNNILTLGTGQPENTIKQLAYGIFYSIILTLALFTIYSISKPITRNIILILNNLEREKIKKFFISNAFVIASTELLLVLLIITYFLLL